MFTSTADVFRTRQALRDLLDVVHLYRDAIFRPGLTGVEQAAIERILARNCRIVAEDDARAYTEIRLAAAVPDEDFNAFIGSTAILLADRLQQGCGKDNLYWNWDAFCGHYMLADPPVRAALMNGFRLGDKLGRISISQPPEEAACLTFGRGGIISGLFAAGADDLAYAVKRGISASEAGRMWATLPDRETAPWHVTAAFRYLYERRESLDPPDPDATSLIPWT